MQQTGTLRKRRRRNLAKVNGIGTIAYDEKLDMFTGQNLYAQSNAAADSATFTQLTGKNTRLQLSARSMLEHRRDAANIGRLSSRNRVTRDPSYHQDGGDGDENSESSRNNSVLPRHAELHVPNELPEALQSHKYLLDKVAMQRLKQMIFLGATSGAFPWKWNSKTCRIDKWSSPMEKFWICQWAFITIQMCCLTMFQVYGFYKRLTVERDHYRDVFQNSLSLMWYIWAVFFNTNMYFYKDAIRQYINTMLSFNEKFVQQYLINLDDYLMSGRLVINVVILTNISQVFVTMWIFVRMPYQSWYLFSYIYPKPWYWLIPGVLQEFAFAGQVITSYTLLTWIMVAHTNTLKFWLRETHNNNDSDYTTDDIRSPQTSIETYKALLILNQVFNECMAPLAIPMLKFHVVSSLVPCGYVLIRSMNKVFLEEFPGILTYPVGVFNCSTGGFVVLNMAAEVFDLGCSFIDSWSRTKHKDFRRILMSCPTIKIWVSRLYFMTVATLLTFFKSVFDVITDLIITLP